MRKALLAASLVLVLPAFAQPSEAGAYAQQLQSYIGYGYSQKFLEIVRAGWPPVNAWRAMWVYKNGWDLGYHRGWHEGAYRAYPQWIASWRPAFDQGYAVWLQEMQTLEWSRSFWGSYQKGYYDGYDKGRAAGWDQGRTLDFSAVPPPDFADFGRYARSVRGDPNDPWSDLRNREVVTGPGAF
jgi:hypothetical protein